MIKAFFFIPDLNGGGAERALFNLLNSWPNCENGDLQSVLVVRRWQGEYTGEISDNVSRIILNVERSGSWATISTILSLGKELRRQKPDMIVSFLSAPSVFLAARLFYPSCKVILSIQTSPSQWVLNDRKGNKSLILAIQRFFFRRADYLLPISEGIASELRGIYGVSDSTIKVIHNSVDLDLIGRESIGASPPEMEFNAGTFRIVTAGRLVRQKTQEILIEAVAELIKIGKRVELFILGQGPDEAYLENIAYSLGVRENVHFLGFQKNPWRYFKNADLFALSSKFEGFANVIIEAMACGLPIVSTDAPHGPREILQDGINGILVPVGDSRAMARAIQKLMDDEELRREYGERSLQRARDFDIRRISRKYREALVEILATIK